MSIDLRVLATHALGIALGYADAGVHEVGANAGEQVEFFQATTGGVKGESWCADMDYACLLKAYCQLKGYLTGITVHDDRAAMLSHADEFTRRTGIPRTGSCIMVAHAANSAHRFHGKEFSPSPGDLVLFDFKGENAPHHVGFVVGLNVDGTLRTVEGNTSGNYTDPQANGDGVFKKTRRRGPIYGFVHFQGVI